MPISPQWTVVTILLVLALIALLQKPEPIILEQAENQDLPTPIPPSLPISVSPPGPKKLPTAPPSAHKPGPGARLELLEGRKLLGVHYGLANYATLTETLFSEAIHSIDLGILFQFEGGIWLNWIWEEDAGEAFFLSITHTDVRSSLEDGITRIREASHIDAWKPFLGKPVQKLEKEMITGLHGNILTDLRLWFGEERVSVCGSEEYLEEDWDSLTYLPKRNEWSYVLFGDDTAKDLRR